MRSVFFEELQVPAAFLTTLNKFAKKNLHYYYLTLFSEIELKNKS